MYVEGLREYCEFVFINVYFLMYVGILNIFMK